MSANDGPENQQSSGSPEGPANKHIRDPIARELKAFKEQQHADSEAARTTEEGRHRWNVITAIGVWVYTLLTLGIVAISIGQLRQSDRNASQQHTDTMEALARADRNAGQQHQDTMDALARADQNASNQHADTIEALRKSDIANATARDTERRQLRGYVYLVTRIENFAVNQTPDVGVTVKNGGSTPVYGINSAMHVRYEAAPRVEGSAGPSSWKPDYLKPLRNSGDYVYQTKETFVSMPSQGFSTVVDQATYDAVMQKRAAIFFFGQIAYRDAFLEPHYTNFCEFIYDADVSMNLWHHCAAHNDAN